MNYNYGKMLHMSTKPSNLMSQNPNDFTEDTDSEYTDSKYISAEEREYFAQAIDNHLPFNNTQQSKELGSSYKRRPKKLFVANPSIEVDLQKDPHQDDSFKRPGLQTSIMSKLTSGKIKPQIELDLHGMQVIEAGRALAEIINNAYQDGYECVIVIHGKGSTGSSKSYEATGHRSGKLKSYVMAWLKDNPMVLGFCRSLANIGGSGATYILLSKS
ncbi:MAG: hypothetical protein HAW61_00315 [Candidatus Portiera sp.]|nr:hypothetical protein [Portiera sp.]